VLKSLFLRPRVTAAADADIHSEQLAARLEAAPFQGKNQRFAATCKEQTAKPSPWMTARFFPNSLSVV
jgi:hypothetical protein